MRDANAVTPPAAAMASSRAVISGVGVDIGFGLTHDRENCSPLTTVSQVARLITVVNDLNTVGERVKWARAQRGLSQKALAELAGVATGTIGNLESGTRGRPRELLSIARALGASVDWLDTGAGYWEADKRWLNTDLVPYFLAMLEGSVNVRKLKPEDFAMVPTWLRHAIGPRHVPDFALTWEGREKPLFVEMKLIGGDPSIEHKRLHDPVFRQYQELAKAHPDELALFLADAKREDYGIAEFLDSIGAPGPRRTDVRRVLFSRDQHTFEAPQRSKPHGLEPILAWDHPDDLPQGDFVMIPRLDVHLSAGGGTEQVEVDLVKDNPQAFRTEWIRLMRLKPAKLAAMRASGESMEPTIYDGDSLLVDTSQTNVQDGKVYALWYDGGERVKRLFRMPGGGLRIVSDNPKHPTMEVAPDHPEHVRIIGRVVHRSSVGGL